MMAAELLTAVMRHIGRFDLDPYPAPQLPPSIQSSSLTLYLHVPFCAQLCPYCSFNRYVYSEAEAHAYFAGLRREIDMAARIGYPVRALYIGGGTPTILPDELARSIDYAADRFPIQQVSAETNPNHLTPQIFEALGGRINRISVGVQSFDDGLLARMHRLAPYGSGVEIMGRLLEAEGHFDTLNLDLIFNLPGQSESQLRHDLRCALESGANQITTYPLMVSPSVASTMRHSMGEVDMGREHEMYRVVEEALNGPLTPVSVWTYNKGTQALLDEYIVDETEYVGLGAGAFSYLNGTLFTNYFGIGDYLRRVMNGAMSVQKYQVLSPSDQMRYALMTSLHGLRLDKAAWATRFGAPVERSMWAELGFLKAAGAFSVDDDREIRLSETGRYLLLVMMREFFIKANDLRDQARVGVNGSAQPAQA